MEPKIALTEVTKQTVSIAHLNVRISVTVFETEAFVLLAILRVSVAQVKKLLQFCIIFKINGKLEIPSKMQERDKQ